MTSSSIGILNSVRNGIELYECLAKFVSDVKKVQDSGLLEKLRKRCKETDPVTGKPRYGEKTMDRVKALLDRYDELSSKIDLIRTRKDGDICDISQVSLNDHKSEASSLYDFVVALMNKEKQDNDLALQIQMSDEEKARLKREEIERQEEQKIKMEKEERMRKQAEKDAEAERQRRTRVKRDEIEKRKKEEEEKQRKEEEKRIIDAIVRGEEGVRIQLNRLRESCGNDRAALRVALRSLHILFSQITSRPEELRFRLIRSNHPQFEQDIGRWPGGREVLIASGFEIIEIEKITCYITKEPSLETDMDAWSDWFNSLKITVEAIEDEMAKI